MNKELIIDPEFRDLIPPLQPAELEQLHKSLTARGCRDKLVVWKDKNILLDGHNRYTYCVEKGIPFEVEELRCFNREAAYNWIILNQLGRRNLSPDAAALLRAKLYNERKKKEGRPEKRDQNEPVKPERTSEAIAKETGVSPATVKRNVEFHKAVEEQGLEAEVMAGKVKRRDVMKAKHEKAKAAKVPRDWDFDTALDKLHKYIYKKFADVPASDKSEFREALIEKIKETI